MNAFHVWKLKFCSSDYATHESEYSHKDIGGSQLEDIGGTSIYKPSSGYGASADWEAQDKIKESVNDTSLQSNFFKPYIYNFLQGTCVCS